MDVYQSPDVKFLYVFITSNISLIYFIYFDISDPFETSLIAGFLFFLISQFFIQFKRLNTGYNKLNYKIIYR